MPGEDAALPKLRPHTISTVRAAALAALVALACAACSPDREASREAPEEPASARGEDDAAASEPEQEDGLPAVIFEPEGEEPARVLVEVADTPAAIQRGLMYREHLPSDHGMLFVFTDEDLRSFWMKNTFIPLDIIFLGADREVVGIVADAEPETTTPRRVDEPSQYVVEVNAGFSRQHGIEAGTPVRFEGVK